MSDNEDTLSKIGEIHEYAFSLAEFITGWNRAERVLHLILNELIGGTAETFIVIVEMGNRSVVNALLSYAADKMNEVEKRAINHLMEYFNRILGHRNYLVHGLHLLAYDNKTNQAVGEVYAVSSKSRLILHHEVISKTDLEEKRVMLTNLSSALTWMHIYVGNRRSQTTQKNLRLEEFQQDFPLPDALVRPRSFPLST